jgi:transposase
MTCSSPGQGPWRTQAWSTSIADVASGQLLDVIEGRSAVGACQWFAVRPPGWCEQIDWAVLDLSGPWRLTLNTVLPSATQVADPFHLVKLANQRLDEVRRRVQNETLGHRGRKHDPLDRSRRPSPALMTGSTTEAAAGCWPVWVAAVPGIHVAGQGLEDAG